MTRTRTRPHITTPQMATAAPPAAAPRAAGQRTTNRTRPFQRGGRTRRATPTAERGPRRCARKPGCGARDFDTRRGHVTAAASHLLRCTNINTNTNTNASTVPRTLQLPRLPCWGRTGRAGRTDRTVWDGRLRGYITMPLQGLPKNSGCPAAVVVVMVVVVMVVMVVAMVMAGTRE